MSTRLTQILVAAGTVVAAACESHRISSPVTLEYVHLLVLSPSYARSDTIKVLLKNDLDTEIYHDGSCAFTMERRVEGKWESSDAAHPHDCGVSLDLFGVGEHSEAVLSQPIRDWMPAGKYRLLLWIGLNHGSDVRLISNHFVIRPAFTLQAQSLTRSP